jgi:AraC family transcriptional regulator, arabinose operon regulatory protein
MKLEAIGYHHIHDENFVLDRRLCGVKTWFFLLVKTPASFMLEDGKEIVIKKNSFVIYKANTTHYYRAYKETYIDDWFYFSVGEEEEELFERLRIPLGKIIKLENINELSSLINMMAYEYYSSDLHHDEITIKYLQVFFLKLSRLLIVKEDVSSNDFSSKHEKLINLRMRIIHYPTNISTVDKMAEELSMSYSGFQHIYKKTFGVNVMQDVINSKLTLAKKLLATTNLSIAEIAAQSGYHNEFHFIRQFKKKIGMTPTDYRKAL